MKTIVILIIFLFSYQLQAACKCNCSLADNRICASSYDLDEPCKGLCPSQTSTNIVPIGRTACPTLKVYNPIKGMYEWQAFCLGDP
jgi:hypothetical protein